MGRLNSFSPKNRSTPIPDLILADLRLWLTFLHRAHRGISLNLLTMQQPDRDKFLKAMQEEVASHEQRVGPLGDLTLSRHPT